MNHDAAHATPSQPSAPADQALRARKRELRGAAQARRDALSPEQRRQAAHDAARHALPELTRARTVAAYVARGSELDPAPVIAGLHARGVTVAVPRVVRGNRQLAFHVLAPPPRAHAASQLVPGVFGLLEPAPDTPTVPLDQIDAFLVPGLAFDRRGNRLGWGCGYYDHTLAAALHALRIGFGYACQLVPEVPAGPRDVACDIVLADTGAVRAARRPGMGRR